PRPGGAGGRRRPGPPDPRRRRVPLPGRPRPGRQRGGRPSFPEPSREPHSGAPRVLRGADLLLPRLDPGRAPGQHHPGRADQGGSRKLPGSPAGQLPRPAPHHHARSLGGDRLHDQRARPRAHRHGGVPRPDRPGHRRRRGPLRGGAGPHCWKRSNPVVIATRTCEPPPALCPVGKMTSALSSNGSDVRPNRSTWVQAVSRSVTTCGPPVSIGEANPIPVPKKPPLVLWMASRVKNRASLGSTSSSMVNMPSESSELKTLVRKESGLLAAVSSSLVTCPCCAARGRRSTVGVMRSPRRYTRPSSTS